MNTPANTARAVRLRLLLVLALIVAVGALLYVAPLDRWLGDAGEWARLQPLPAAVLYIGFATLGAVLFLPGSVIAMSAGYVYGLGVGTPLALLAITSGACAAFFSGRLLVRDWVLRQFDTHPRLQLLDRAVSQRSFLIVMLTRLSLIIPYNVLNYAFGVTGVRATAYAASTALGMIPATLLWTYIGTLAKNLTEIRAGEVEADVPSEYVLLAGLCMLVVAVFIVHRTATRMLNERLQQ